MCQILDNICFQVEPLRGRFWLRDVNTFLEFYAEVYVSSDGGQTHLEAYEIEAKSENTIAEQLCDSEEFASLIKSAVLSEYPDRIEGFDDWVEEVGSYNYAIEILEERIGTTADTLTKLNNRWTQNVKASGDFYSAAYGW